MATGFSATPCGRQRTLAPEAAPSAVTFTARRPRLQWQKPGEGQRANSARCSQTGLRLSAWDEPPARMESCARSASQLLVSRVTVPPTATRASQPQCPRGSDGVSLPSQIQDLWVELSRNQLGKKARKKEKNTLVQVLLEINGHHINVRHLNLHVPRGAANSGRVTSLIVTTVTAACHGHVPSRGPLAQAVAGTEL